MVEILKFFAILMAFIMPILLAACWIAKAILDNENDSREIAKRIFIFIALICFEVSVAVYATGGL